MESKKPAGQILSLGSINADLQMRVARRPEVSETLLASDFRRFAGGKAANVAYLGRKLGLSARLFAHTGEDDFAEQALRPLREAGVDLSGVKKLPGHDTGVAIVLVPPDGKKGIIMAANANLAWGQQDVQRVVQAIREAPAGSVLVTDCEIPHVVIEQALQTAREQGLTTILDPSPADQVSERMLTLCDVLTPNAGEAQRLTGVTCATPPQAVQAAQQLLSRGAGAVCVKLSDGGCIFARNAQVLQVFARPVEVVDTTGAGDAFAGGLAAALAQGRTWPEAAAFAVAASHLAVGGYGSQPAYPGLKEVEEMAHSLEVSGDVRRSE